MTVSKDLEIKLLRDKFKVYKKKTMRFYKDNDYIVFMNSISL